MYLEARLAGFIADRETIRLILRSLDTERVEMCAVHKLHSRVYVTKGPKEEWQIDGYGKHKPIGFAIHRCIDRSARNNPAVFSYYILECLHQVKIGPNDVRSDRVTENVYISDIQHYLRRNDQNTVSCFGYGSSSGSQRIESWRSQFR